MDAVQEHENPNLRAIVFRSSFVEMTDIIDKTRRLYAPLGGVFVGSPKWTWSFPSGATIRFAYMKTDDDVWKYLGPRYSFIGFDESTLHTEKQVRNILGRLSSTDASLRLRMRLTSNPGNVGAAWHQTLFLRGHCPVHNARRRGPTRPTLPRSLLALGWRGHSLLRCLYSRQALRSQSVGRELLQAPAHDVWRRSGGHGAGLLVHAGRRLLPFHARRHGAPAGRGGRGVVAQPLPLHRLRLWQILFFGGALRPRAGGVAAEHNHPRHRVTAIATGGWPAVSRRAHPQDRRAGGAPCARL